MTNELGIFVNNNRVVVSSRDVARVFEKSHKNVIQSIRGLECNEEFNRLNFQPVEYTDAKGEKRPEYLITRDGFTLLAMGFTGQKAMDFKIRYIAAFNKMEKELTLRQHGYSLPSNYLEALEALVHTEKARQALAAQIEQDKHKVVFAEAVSVSDTDILMRDMAKLLRQNGFPVGEKRLFALFREKGYLMRTKRDWNRPTQRAMELGLFRIQERVVFNHVGKPSRTVFTPYVTPKGQLYFINAFKNGTLGLDDTETEQKGE